MSFMLDRAQADFESPPDIWDEDSPCSCPVEEIDEGVLARVESPDCQMHSEPPCDRCGWAGACPDCDPQMPWER